MGNLKAVSNIFRPQGPKIVSTGNTWAKGAQVNLNNQVDLSVPIVGLRFVISGRIAVTTAAYTSVKPEQLLGLLQQLTILGTNTRQKGQLTLFQMDLASWAGFQTLVNPVPFHYFISKAAGALTQAPFPSSPYSLGTGFDGTVNNFDFKIVFEVPFWPQKSGDAFIPGWAVRNSEWGDSLQIQMTFAKLADNAENEIGVSAATSVTSLTAFGSGAGSPTVDVYSLPNIAGAGNDSNILPGVISRVSTPITAFLAASGVNVTLIQNLQKQNTGRIFVKTGVSTFFPNFSSLSDTIITALGLSVGQNRSVRNLVDVFSHKFEWSKEYDVQPVQGYMGFDFLQSDNPFSAYPGMAVGGGATFSLNGNVTTVANAAGIVVQEQQLYQPDGALYQA